MGKPHWTRHLQYRLSEHSAEPHNWVKGGLKPQKESREYMSSWDALERSMSANLETSTSDSPNTYSHMRS